MVVCDMSPQRVLLRAFNFIFIQAGMILSIEKAL